MKSFHYVLFGVHPENKRVELTTIEHHGKKLSKRQVIKKAVKNGNISRKEVPFIEVVSEVSNPLTFKDSMEFSKQLNEWADEVIEINNIYSNYPKTERKFLLAGVKPCAVDCNKACGLLSIQLKLDVCSSIPAEQLLNYAKYHALLSEDISIEEVTNLFLIKEIDTFLDNEDDLMDEMAGLLKGSV